MKKMIEVVAALIENDGQVLIAKRSTGDPQTLGMWEFPGGKVEAGEVLEEALAREMEEEFEIQVEVLEYLTNSIFTYPDKTINLKLYRCSYVSGNFHLHAHSEYAFVPYEELPNYEFAPADVPFVKKIKNL